MEKKRKEFLDSLWMDTDVGKWAQCKAIKDNSGADKIKEELFSKGHLSPMEYLMIQEKQVCKSIKHELESADEGRHYILEIEKNNPDLFYIMYAYEFSLLDLYYA